MPKVAWYHARLWSGMNLAAWLRLLAKNRCAISPSRLPLALSLSALAAGNSALAVLQSLLYGRRAGRLPLPDNPLFILGHWRTGTTLTHELLALDPQNRCPTTYESLCPNHFLVSQIPARRWLRFLVPETRPMDAMPVGFQRPQEDEVALCNLGCPSPFLSVAFPNRPPQDPAYVTLEDVSPAARRRWIAVWQRFLKNVLYNRLGRLVLKSPQHTYRVPLLLEVFPRARFIYLTRDPYEVFPSTVHFWKSMQQSSGLQTPRFEHLEEQVFEDFLRMHRCFEASRPLIPAERLATLKYEELTQDPAGSILRVYQHLRLSASDAFQAQLQRYADSTRDYQPNQYALDPERKRQIRARWQDYFETHGYD